MAALKYALNIEFAANYLLHHVPFNNDPLFPSPTEAPKRSPAPEDMPEMSEKLARLEWFGVPMPFGGELWCNPGVPELGLLQEWLWLIFKWLLADMELFCKCCWTLECELVLAPPPCK